MSTKPNHRRGEPRRHDNGPRWEGGGSDNSAVARARKQYAKRLTRATRRTGSTPRKYLGPYDRPIPTS